MNLIFQKKSYCFKLSAKVENSKTTYHTKSGWIIKLTSNDKKIGFGEVSPLNKEDLKKCAKQLDMIPEYIEEFNLSCLLYTSPSPRDLKLSRMPSSA